VCVESIDQVFLSTETLMLKLLFFLNVSYICNITQVCVRLCSDDYFRMKLQWKSIDADQESRFTDLRDRRSLIGMLLPASLCVFVFQGGK